jgi:hypothetical protein
MTAVTTYYCDECDTPFNYDHDLVTYGIHHYCIKCAKALIVKMLTEAIPRIEAIDRSNDDAKYRILSIDTVTAIYNATENIVLELDEYEGVGE